MASFEYQIKDIDEKNSQQERRLELLFAKLGDVLIEIATRPEIHSTDNKQLYPLPATQEVCHFQEADTEGVVSVPQEPNLPSNNNIEHCIDEMET